MWSIPVATVEAVRIESARLLGVSTDALVIDSPAGVARFALARPHRRAGRDLAGRLLAGARRADVRERHSGPAPTPDTIRWVIGGPVVAPVVTVAVPARARALQ